jgi:hypothetical protein
VGYLLLDMRRTVYDPPLLFQTVSKRTSENAHSTHSGEWRVAPPRFLCTELRVVVLMYMRRPQSEGRTPVVIDGGAARPKIRRGTDLRGKKDPFPILGTLYAKRGLVRIGRKDSKSIVPHQ